MNSVYDNEWNGDGGELPPVEKCKPQPKVQDTHQWIESSAKEETMNFGGKVDPTTNIPTRSSAGSAWIQWYTDLKDNFGKKQANALFLKAWQKRGTSDANTHELRELLKKNGVDLEKGALSSLYDTGAGVIDDIGGFLQMGKYAVYAVGGIAILGLGMVVYNVAKNPGQAAGVALKTAI